MSLLTIERRRRVPKGNAFIMYEYDIFSNGERGAKGIPTHKIEEESEISFLVVGLIIDQVFHCPRGLRDDYRGHLLLLQFCL
jgi:hypothetical protein